MLRCIPLLFLAVPLLAAEPKKESREDIVKRLAEAKKAQWAQEDIVDPLAANPKTTTERMLMENQKLYDLETVVIDLKRNLAKIDGMQFKEPERRFGNVVIPRGETPKQTLERLTREAAAANKEKSDQVALVRQLEKDPKTPKEKLEAETVKLVTAINNSIQKGAQVYAMEGRTQRGVIRTRQRD